MTVQHVELLEMCKNINHVLCVKFVFLMTLPKISRSVPAPRMRSLLLVLALAPCAAIKVGDKLPSVDLDWGFPPDKVPMGTWTDGKTSVIVGLPGAFTPT